MKGFRLYGGFLVLMLGATLLYCNSIAQGPDYDVQFVREVRSPTSQAILGSVFSAPGNWLEWFFSLADAKVVNQLGVPFSLKDQVISPGAVLRLSFDPKKGKRHRFDLLMRVVEYTAGRNIRLLLLEDSKGSLTALFNRLEWQIELLPQTTGGTLIRGVERVHTSHWKARLFGKIAERTLMNQVFYPDLIRLGQQQKALPANSALSTQQ